MGLYPVRVNVHTTQPCRPVLDPLPPRIPPPPPALLSSTSICLPLSSHAAAASRTDARLARSSCTELMGADGSAALRAATALAARVGSRQAMVTSYPLLSSTLAVWKPMPVVWGVVGGWWGWVVEVASC